MLRILIVCYGDIAVRMARLLRRRAKVYALTRGEATRDRARASGARGVPGDLDNLKSLRRIAGIADALIHLAPPPNVGADDARTRHLLAALAHRAHWPRRFVYVSTSGVYGDHGGAWVSETTPLRATSARALRRVAAEGYVRAWSRGKARLKHRAEGRAQCGPPLRAWSRGKARLKHRTESRALSGLSYVDSQKAARDSRLRTNKPGLSRSSVRFTSGNGPMVSILRVPGIYARERLPLERLRARQPVLHAHEDVYTNHIHADDLAQIVLSALFRGRNNRVYNATDESQLKMGAYLDAVAAAYALSAPPRVARAEAQRVLSEASLSFMSESRRLSGARMRKELRVRLRYPTVNDFLAPMRP